MLSKERQSGEVPENEYENALDDAAPIKKPEDRHGQFLLRQLKPEHPRLPHEISSLDKLFSEAMIWKEGRLYSVVTSIMFLCI